MRLNQRKRDAIYEKRTQKTYYDNGEYYWCLKKLFFINNKQW